MISVILKLFSMKVPEATTEWCKYMMLPTMSTQKSFFITVLSVETSSYMPLPLQMYVKLIRRRARIRRCINALRLLLNSSFDNYVRRLTADAAAHNETLYKLLGFRYSMFTAHAKATQGAEHGSSLPPKQPNECRWKPEIVSKRNL